MKQEYYDIATKSDLHSLQYGKAGEPAHDHEFVVKFADLIIQECIDICERGGETQTTSQGAAVLIRQRFGIQ